MPGLAGRPSDAGTSALPRPRVDGLSCDGTRKPGKPQLGEQTVPRMVRPRLCRVAGRSDHWSGRAHGQGGREIAALVPRIWRAHNLQAAAEADLHALARSS